MTTWWNQQLRDVTMVKMIKSVYVDEMCFQYTRSMYDEDCS